jgi:ALG6, ALG8 glycosyltransferase family
MHVLNTVVSPLSYSAISDSCCLYHYHMLCYMQVFTVLFMMKHLYLCLAPVYFVHLLRAYCLAQQPHTTATTASSKAANTQSSLAAIMLKFVLLGGSVLSICAVALAPLCWDERTSAFMDMQQCEQQVSLIFLLCMCSVVPYQWHRLCSELVLSMTQQRTERRHGACLHVLNFEKNNITSPLV